VSHVLRIQQQHDRVVATCECGHLIAAVRHEHLHQPLYQSCDRSPDLAWLNDPTTLLEHVVFQHRAHVLGRRVRAVLGTPRRGRQSVCKSASARAMLCIYVH
jgi:hypothetical protein